MNAVHRPTGEHHPDTPAAATRVALYTRGYEPSTLDRQEAALRHYLATVQPAWRVVAVYQDTAPTGGWRDIRPGLRSALAAAGAGTYDVLLVQHVDRLSRRIEHGRPRRRPVNPVGSRLAVLLGGRPAAYVGPIVVTGSRRHRTVSLTEAQIVQLLSALHRCRQD
jgi:hypothetical protein